MVFSRGTAREYGDFLLMRNKLNVATPPHELDLSLTRALLQSPEIIAAQYELGDVYYRSATLALKKGNRALADSLYRKCLEARTVVADARPADPRRPYYLANAQARCGKHEAAFTAMDAIAAAEDSKRNRFATRQCAFNIALCADAVQAGRSDDKLNDAEKQLRDKYADRAIDLIEHLVSKLGYVDAVQLKTDPDLDSIRNLPRFQKLIAGIEANTKRP